MFERILLFDEKSWNGEEWLWLVQSLAGDI
jgi:hypothetical protein